MTTRLLSLFLTAILLSASLYSHAFGRTDPLDVQALQDMYVSLNRPPQLEGWADDGGDPCDDSWTGVSCFASSVIYIKLEGLNLTGILGSQLSNLQNLKQLDLSSNNITGEIPHNLPFNVTRLNLACNNLSDEIPYALAYMKNLRHLNLSKNSLFGPIGNVFDGLQNLREMDLSYNCLSGDLPVSFRSLKNLTRLFLQNNKFTGSVHFLDGLSLSELNIQENHFSGVIPHQFEQIQNLWIGGNKFRPGANDTPWNFPLENVPKDSNFTHPVTTTSSAIKSHPSHKAGKRKARVLGPGGIALMVGGITLFATCAALFIAVQSNLFYLKKCLESNTSPESLPVGTAREFSSTMPERSSHICAIRTPLRTGPRLPPICNKSASLSRRSFSMKHKIPLSAKIYTVAELEYATNSFSERNLLGEGSLGCVYKAEFPDGRIAVVKSINTAELSLNEEDQFLDVIWSVARLRHPNVVTLLGYCVDHRNHLLVYEYVRNLSLENALHSEAYVPLSWNLRLQISLGVARALEYMHSTYVPPIAHGNLKAANVLVDEDLKPWVSDCGIAILRPLTSNSIKLKASEIAIENTGYIAPEKIHSGIDNTKADIFAFGVLLLELLTGRVPFDGSKPEHEQSLVAWASSQLHDRESLEQMVDPSISNAISPRTLSQIADIVSLCVQPEKEFRPPISEVLEYLMHLLNKHGTENGFSTETSRVESNDRSFLSAETSLFGSPTLTYFPV